MIFVIRRGSDTWGKNAPCAGAVLAHKEDVESVWTIEIADLNAFMALYKKVGPLVLPGYNYAPHPELCKLTVIEIYDSYRE